jgi:hypothetical protein
MSEENKQPTVSPEEQQKQTIEKLQKVHIHFCTPMYGGNITETCFGSYMRFALMAMKYNIQFSVDTMVNESLITRGRNNLVAKFLANPKATHLMWVDADIKWDPESVLRMTLYDAGVVCGLYPMKGIPIRYVLNALPGGRRIGPLLEVSTSGTGFMLIKREVIEKLIAVMPETKYKDSLNLGPQFEQHMYALFDTMIDSNGHYLSEDWTFCKRVREKLNMPIWVDTDIKLDHMGSYNFPGSVDEIKKLADEWGENLKSNTEQLQAYEKIREVPVVTSEVKLDAKS